MILKPKQLVQFDSENKEHIDAMYLMLAFGKLHPTLRFEVENPFTNAVDMATHIMALKYASTILGKEFDVKTSLREAEAVSETTPSNIPTLETLSNVKYIRPTHKSFVSEGKSGKVHSSPSLSPRDSK
jgi:hypothetical protein